MAELYLGVARFESGFKKICAVKKLLPEHAGKATFIEIMRSEARIGETLSHPNVVQVLGFDRVEGTDAIIMEYVQGVDLGRLIAKSVKRGMAISTPMALLIVADIARALAYIHSCRDHSTGEAVTIIHADISPGNVLISFQSEVKLADFGIACARLSGRSDAAPAVRGKYSYMPPEQAAGAALTPATDYFSLGCVLWELLTGEQLFDRPAPPAHFAKLEPEALAAAFRVRCPEENNALEAILFRCLAADPAARYASATDLERDLHEVVQARYDSFTRQRLGTFVKTLFAKELAELDALIQGAVNHSVVEEERTQALPAAPDEPPAAAGPPPGRPLPGPPPPQFYAGSQPDRTKIHRGKDLTLVGQVPDPSVEHMPVGRSSEPVPVPPRAGPYRPRQAAGDGPARSRPPQSLTAERLAGRDRDAEDPPRQSRPPQSFAAPRAPTRRQARRQQRGRLAACLVAAVAVSLAGVWYIRAPRSRAAAKAHLHAARPAKPKVVLPDPKRGAALPVGDPDE